jgi:hypothetical protein
MRKSRINIKKLLKDKREDELVRMKDRRKKMLQLVFKRDFKNLRMELQTLKLQQ